MYCRSVAASISLALLSLSLNKRSGNTQQFGVAILSGRVVCVCGKESAAKRYNLKSIDMPIWRRRSGENNCCCRGLPEEEEDDDEQDVVLPSE